MGWGHKGTAVQREAPLLAPGEGLWWGLQHRAGQGGCQEGVGGLPWPQSLWDLQPALLPALPQGMDFRADRHWGPYGGMAGT